MQRKINKLKPIRPSPWRGRLVCVWRVTLLAIIYYVAGYIGFMLEGGQRGVMPIPLPAGIALAALLLFSVHLWPGIVVGLFLLNTNLKAIPLLSWLDTDMNVPLMLTSFSALGAIVQAIFATQILKYFQFRINLSQVRDTFLFGIIVFIIAPLLGSSVAMIGLFLENDIPSEYLGEIWLTSWFNDGISMLVLTSTLLVWRQLPVRGYNYWHLLEGIAVLLCLTIVSSLTLQVDYGNRLIFLYLILPFAVWAAVRFQQHGATLAALIIAAILLSGGLNRIYPTGELIKTSDLLLEIGFISITSFTAFLVAAAYAERYQAEDNLHKEKELANNTLHSIADAVITTDSQGRITYLNPVAEELIGYTNYQAINQPITESFQLKSLEPDATIENPVARCLRGVISLPRQSLLVTHEQRAIAIENSVAPIRDRHGQIEGVIMVFHDVSKEHRLREQLSHQASHDALTGLYNRREFEYQLASLINNAKTKGQEHSFLYLDLDQFKIINDTKGHAAGDALLKQLVTVLQTRVRQGDIFARLGGDEFGILLKDCSIEYAAVVAEAYLNTVRDFRFVWEDRNVEIGVSIGVVPVNAQTETMAAVLSNADLACYAAKDKGRNCIHVSIGEDEKLMSIRQGEMLWVSRIIKAIEEDRLVLYKQKIAPVDPDKQSEVHGEILIRMRDEDGKIIFPGSFLPAAERYNLMPRIDRWVVHKVFTYLASQPQEDNLTDFIAINLSGATLNDPSFAQFIRDELKILAVPAQLVCFEITETTAISSLDKVVEFMQELSQLGFRFALDDFGSGVSSFGYLKQLPVNYLKLDGSFVRDMVIDPIDHAIVEAVTQIGHVMKLKTIAEWVENEATLLALKAIGVDFAQGFGIGKPELFL
jgi:diguanylate cyclase (GGDEF)-like protein/PAS domain S-box-containing protein